jgi:hypothetical protein
LLVNAGPTGPAGGVTGGTTIVNYGSTAKGNGYYDDIVSVNGGVISGGFSPGVLNVGTYNMNGSGGTFLFEITDAGPSATFPSAPGTAGNNPGWDTVAATTRIRFTATPTDKYTIILQTQLPTGTDVAGPMANFDQHQPYSWLFASNPTGSVVDGSNQPTAFDPAAITLATNGTFLNAFDGTFALRITPNGQQVFLDYTPVPEPLSLLAAATALAIGIGRPWPFRRFFIQQSPHA